MRSKEIKVYISEPWEDLPAQAGYELLDTGEGEKLERVGKYIFVRPYEDAYWKKTLKKEWQNVDGRFTNGKWSLKDNLVKNWIMEYHGVKWKAIPTSFRHFGFFPEQASQWQFISDSISKANRPIKFLNLFGYTGVASLFALKAGGEVTHVDASRTSIDWAKENQKLNLDLIDAPMRVIVDDAIKFLEREHKRGVKYDAVIMDPPKFGRGPKGEVWKIEEKMPKLLEMVRKILSDQPLFVILTSYATDSSSLSLGYALGDVMEGLGGTTDNGELCIREKSTGRAIPLANTAIWHS